MSKPCVFLDVSEEIREELIQKLSGEVTFVKDRASAGVIVVELDLSDSRLLHLRVKTVTGLRGWGLPCAVVVLAEQSPQWPLGTTLHVRNSLRPIIRKEGYPAILQQVIREICQNTAARFGLEFAEPEEAELDPVREADDDPDTRLASLGYI